MAQVFNEEREMLSDDYIDRLLSREEFWAIAAFADDQIVGGITAHTLPMTRAETSEVFIYDVAVRHDHQRKGIGRQLVSDCVTAPPQREFITYLFLSTMMTSMP
jgi:aminoglycoside 3-N-acetyltransferase I